MPHPLPHPAHPNPLARLRTPGLLQTAALVNGQWLPGAQRFAVHDPATELHLADVANLGPSEAQAAIAAASAAWPEWRARSAKARSQVLRRWFELLLAHQHDLALLMTAEQGKPLAEAQAEVAYAASFVEWYAEEAKRVLGETLSTYDANRRLLVLRQPVGVCAAITPWNFPLAMITRKVAPALAAGCPVIIKPAEQTPLTALAAAGLAQQAGLPAGVLHCLSADAAQSVAIGQVLCASPEVRHLSFTGSTEVGRLLMAQCAPTVKKLALELGGNAPFIVFDDADLDSAVDGALASKYRNSGQTCVCANRFYVQSGVYDAFVERLAQRLGQARVGNGFDSSTTLGPLINAAALEKVERHLDDALALGARLVLGGQRLSSLGAGAFFAPTVLADCHAGMLCAREETFGPLAPVFRFETEHEAITAANATEFGLASYFYSRDIGRIWRVSEALESGMVGVNVGLLASEHVPFGGVKQSGLGREGSHHGMDEYLELKYVCVGDVQARA